ncbi:hypothetical protein VitviT2T_004402 [Vitis vinifera]|uniref:Ribosomal eL28/Mak16 domain-containing protein n=1 Tax=Vitis vinifera TaxID=29760 RepID=A0ABY9BPE1_VITVI|nr:hypothetical protein VitviT2T_004402 [Vitis vinifera]
MGVWLAIYVCLGLLLFLTLCLVSEKIKLQSTLLKNQTVISLQSYTHPVISGFLIFVNLNAKASAICADQMANVPGPLIWEIVKKNNSFLVKEFGNGTAKVQFSKETNNLCNVHSFKHSGNKSS